MRSALVILSVAVAAALPATAAARQIAPAQALPPVAALPGFVRHAVPPARALAWERLTGVRHGTQQVWRDRSHALIVRVAGGPAAAARIRLHARRELAIDRVLLHARRVPSPALVALPGGVVAELVIATQPRGWLRAALTRMLRAQAARAAALTPWTALLAQVRRHGLTVRDALRAFAMSVAPLPGVTVPRAGGPTDGTLAVRWVAAIAWKLSPAQRQAVTQALTARPPAATRSTFQYDLGFQQRADSAAKAEAAQLGFDLTIPIVAGTGPKDGISNAVTTPIDLQGEPLLSLDANGTPNHPLFACRIAVTPQGQAQFGDRLDETMYHEVFHCFQLQMAGTARWLRAGKDWDWLYEGSAEWVGCAMAPGAGDANGWYAAYLTDPLTAILDRDYADMGFYAHLAEEGVDTWGRWPSVFQQDSMQGALDVAIGANDQQVFDTWAPGFARDAARGPWWDAKAPCIPADKAPLGLVTAYKGNAPNHVAVEAYANRLDELSSDTGALAVLVETGHGRLSSADGAIDEGVGGDVVCVKSGGCHCPDGFGNEEIFKQATSPVLALGGGRKGGSALVAAIDIDAFCKRKQGPSDGNDGGGYSNGDPHMQTFDGVRYDFMAAGEFVLARSTDGSVDVQGRQEPFGLETDVTVNTAIALRAGGHRVVVSIGTQRAPNPVVRIDGRVADPVAAPIDLGGGNRMRGGSDGYTVDLSGGTRITIRNASIWGLVVVIAPAHGLAGKLRGLLGNFDGAQGNDLRVGGGGAAIDPHSRAQLYGAFRRSWLVGRDTLFDYAPGKSTHSYDNPQVPRAPALFNRLPGPTRQAAGAACRRAGVHAEPFLSQCLLDVGVTGKRDFASATAGLQQTLTDNAHRADATPWQNIGSDPPDSFQEVPVLAATGADRALVTWPVRTSTDPEQHELTSVQFTSSAAGAVQPPLVSSNVVAGWVGLGFAPSVWSPAPGQVAVLFTGVRTTSDPNDPYTFKNLSSTLRPDGFWDAPVVVAPTDYDGPAGIGIDGGQPIFIRSVNGSGELLLYHGIDPGQSAPNVYDGGRYATGQVLGRDSAGTVWMAYRTPVGADASGVSMRPFDAQSAQPLGPSQSAPQSAAASDLLEGHAAMACAARCRLVYPNADRTAILSWAPGDTAPVTVAAARDPRQIRCGYDGAGRLWVAWHESGYPNPGFRVVHGDANGAGTARTIPDPTPDGAPADLGRTAVLPLAGGLLIVSNLGIGAGPRGMYATFVSAG